jgi:hypothetical protein
LSNQKLKYLLVKLKEISKKTGLLSIIIISDSYIDLNYTIEDVEKTILIFDEIQQLPEFQTVKKSIEMHYPCDYENSDQSLVNALFRIMPFVGEYNNTIYLRNKDMVVLKVVNEILGFYELHNKNCVEILNETELHFLGEKT